MRDVAAKARVHQTTVSLALRHDRRIPEETREKVARAAKELGYRPHPLLSALGAARRMGRGEGEAAVIAYVMRADEAADARREHLAGARAAAEALGYRMEAFVVGKAGLSEGRLNTVLVARNIHGVVIAPLPEAHGHFALEWERFCAVAIEYTFTEPAFDRVVHDGYASMRLVIARCRERGLRRIGLCLPKAGHERTELLNGAAYWAEQKSEAGLDEIPPLYPEAWSEAEFGEWLKLHRPEAVVSSAMFCPRIKAFARKARLRIPADFSLVNINAARGEGLAGVDQNNAEIGAAAARLVIDKINRNDRGIPGARQTILTQGTWMDGPSFG